MDKTFTKIGFYNAVKDNLEGKPLVEPWTAEAMTEFAAKLIEKDAADKGKRKEKVSKVQEANKVLEDVIYDEHLNGDVVTAADIAAVMNITSAKASALMRGLVKSGRATVTEVKVKGKGKVNGYARAEVTNTAEVTED